MADSPTTRYLREEGPKVYDLLIKIAFPILLGCSAWGFNSLWDHNNRITQIESTNYTKDDAAKDRESFAGETAKISEDVSEIKESLAERRGADKDTARRLDRIEQSIQKILERLSK